MSNTPEELTQEERDEREKAIANREKIRRKYQVEFKVVPKTMDIMDENDAPAGAPTDPPPPAKSTAKSSFFGGW